MTESPPETIPEQIPQPATQPPAPQPAQPSPRPPEPPRHEKRKHSSTTKLAAILLIGLIAGSLISFSLCYVTFNGKIEDLQTQLHNQGNTYISYPNASYLTENVSLANLYEQVRESVVIIQDWMPQYSIFGLIGYSQQQGSGFITLVDDQPVVITNNHVTANSINITVTFANGDSYPATLVGSDPQADLAVLTVDAPESDLQPLTVASSSTMRVGDPVVAVGSPYGLSGTLTTGVISAIGRTITETSGTTAITIADVIQTSTAINPGNSGGPLLNYEGDVVGITTAGVSDSEGLGFAIPSDTILREVKSLVSTGSYDLHPSIQASGIDMSYQIAQAISANVSYGWLVEYVYAQNGLEGGNQQLSVMSTQIIAGGDIIVGINGTRVANSDEMLSYLERNSLPNQTVSFTVIRNDQVQTVDVTIGTA